MISETKLDDSFPTGQFSINEFNKPIRQDRNKNGGGNLLYIREDIPTKVLSFDTLPIDGFYIEINLHNKNWWLLSCSHNPEKGNIKNCLQTLSTILDVYSSHLTTFNILGDFNIEIENSEMKEFCLNYNLKSLIYKILKHLHTLISY